MGTLMGKYAESTISAIRIRSADLLFI